MIGKCIRDLATRRITISPVQCAQKPNFLATSVTIVAVELGNSGSLHELVPSRGRSIVFIALHLRVKTIVRYGPDFVVQCHNLLLSVVNFRIISIAEIARSVAQHLKWSQKVTRTAAGTPCPLLCVTIIRFVLPVSSRRTLNAPTSTFLTSWPKPCNRCAHFKGSSG